MSNYTPSTNFATKDALSSGDPLKIVRGTEINTEFTNIAVAVATKLDTTALASPGPIGATTPAAISGTTGTFSGDVQMASQNGGQLAGLRNKIINGDMNVNQRNATTQALTNPGAYSLDRWYGRCTGTASGTITIGQQAYAIGVGASNNTLRLSKSAGTYAGVLYVAQPLETLNSYCLAGKTVTISFRARAGVTYTGASPVAIIVTGTGINQSAETMITGAWTGSVSQTVTLTGTIGVAFSTFSGTVTLASGISQVGVLLGATYTATTGSANDHLDITDVQLESSPVSTPFEQIPYGLNLLLCQRYYYRLNAVTGSGAFHMCQMNTTTTAAGMVPFPVQMRTNPGALEQTGVAADYRVNFAGANINCSAVPAFNAATNYNNGYVNYTVAAGLVAGQAGSLIANATTAYLGWSAEL